MAAPHDTRPRRSEWRTLAYGVIAGVVIVALLVAAFAIGQNRGETTTRQELAEGPPADTPAAPVPAETDEATLALFSQACGACHTLGAAGTTATIGPSLDTLAPSVEQVLAAIANGGSGTGQMPPNLLQGVEAEQVAEFVAQAAGP